MIKYQIEDTKVPDYKTALLYSEEDIEALLLSFDIHGIGTKDVSTKITIHTTEEILKYFNQKTSIPISDLVAEGKAEGFTKYLVLKLDSNISLLSVTRME